MADLSLRLLPRGYPVRRRGSCVPAAYLLLLANERAAPVEGYVSEGGREIYDEHAWVELDGEIIDPTIRQFSWWRAGVAVERTVVRRAPRDWFLAEFERAYAEPWTDRGHHYRQFAEWVDRGGRRVAQLVAGKETRK